MKKTLITLLALSGLAMGITIEDSVGSIMNVTSTNCNLDFSADPTNYTAFTLTMSMKVDDFLGSLYTSGQNNTNFALGTVKSGVNNIGPAIRFNSSSNTLSSIYPVYSSNANGAASSGMQGMTTGYGVTWTKGGAAFSSAFSQEAIDSWGYDAATGSSNVDRIVYSFAMASSTTGQQNYMSVYLKDGTSIEYAGVAADDYKFTINDVTALSVNAELVQDVCVYGKVLTAEEVATVHTIIPEPTTATLSLLALAGLAARRRRR